MQVDQLQEKASKVFLKNLKRDKIDVNGDYLILKLSEELGEFVQSYIVHQRRCRPEKYMSKPKSKKEMAKELSDVLGLVLVISKYLNIDVEEALIKKWITREWLKKS